MATHGVSTEHEPVGRRALYFNAPSGSERSFKPKTILEQILYAFKGTGGYQLEWALGALANIAILPGNLQKITQALQRFKQTRHLRRRPNVHLHACWLGHGSCRRGPDLGCRLGECTA